MLARLDDSGDRLFRITHAKSPFAQGLFRAAAALGLIHGLGNWVIDESCRQMQAWADVGVRMRVAINVSALELKRHLGVSYPTARDGRRISARRPNPS